MAISLDDLDPVASSGKRLSLDALDPIKKPAPLQPRRKLDAATESLIGPSVVDQGISNIEYERTLTPEKLGEKRAVEAASKKSTAKVFDEVRAKQIASEPKYQSFGKALLAGIDDTQKLIYAGTEAIGEVVGGRSDVAAQDRNFADMLAAEGKAGRERNTQEADQYGRRGEFSQINTVGDAFAWATQTAGNMIPVMVPSMVGGAAGATLAPAVGVTATVGGIAGAFVPGVVVSTGEVQANAKDKDPTKTANGWTFAGGTAIAALDSVLPGRIGGKLVEKFGRDAAEEIALRALLRPAGAKLSAEMAKGALKEGVKSAAIEGLTESVQEAIGEVAASLASESKIDWQGLPKQMIEAGAAGALMGAATGGPSGGITAAKDVADANAMNEGYQAGVNRDAAGASLPMETSTNPADFSSFVDARNKVVSPDPKADVPLTDADRASPLPDELIQAGKNRIADATGVNRPPRAAQPPKTGATFDRMVQIVLGLEGGGTLANPKTSPKGARGPMQVMPGTNSDPGFGVRPARDNSEAERARVGRDYLAAMMRRYGGDPAKALAAYNAGPGAVDNRVKELGDNWLSEMPAETRKYVMNGLSKLGGQAFNPETGEVAPQPVPEQTELDAESSEDFIKRVLGVDIMQPTPNAEPALTAEDLSIESLQAKADALTEAPVGEIEQQGADMRGADIDAEWSNFAEDSGSLGVPRAEMPQIKAENRGALVNYLKARNVTSQEEVVPAAILKPTQQEFSPAKVQKAKEYTGGNRAILVSSDGYVLDGHHQWLAARDNGEDIRTLKLGAPIADLIPLARDFPSSELDAGAQPVDITPAEEVTGAEPRLRGTGMKPTRKGGGFGTFLEYLADIGGVRDDEGHSLSKMRGLQQGIAGAGSLIRRNGKSIDEIGEKAYEDGWFPTRPTTTQVLELIDDAQFKKIYHPNEDVARREEKQSEDQEAFADRLESIAKEWGVDLNEDEMRYATTKIKAGSEVEQAVMDAVEWGAARDLPAILAATQDQDYDLPFEGEAVTDEQARKIDESLSQGSERPQVASEPAPEREEAPQQPSGDSQPEITDSASGKGVIVRGASEAQLEAIKAALPEKASGMVGKDGAVTYSAKHRERIEEALKNAARTFKNARVSSLEGNEEALSQSQRPDILESNRSTGVGEQFSGVSGGDRAASDASTFRGQDKRGDGVSAGERALGNEDRAEPKQAGIRGNDSVSGQNNGSDGLGQGVGDSLLNTGTAAQQGIAGGARSATQEEQTGQARFDANTQRQNNAASQMGGEIRTEENNAPNANSARLAGGEGVGAAAKGLGAVSSYGANNKAFTKDRAEAAREVLRKAANRLNSAGFDPEVAQAGMTLMGFHIEAGARSFIDASKAVAQDLNMTPAALRNSLRSWYMSARMWMEDNGQDVRGMDDADAVKVDMARIDSWGNATAEPTEAVAESPAIPEATGNNDRATLMQAFMAAFREGRGFASITEARALASETLGRKVEAGTADAKMLDEAIETAVIQTARVIAVENTDDAYQAYQRLVGLYGRQPKLTVRTSTSVEQQAYSTPVPLAFLASRLAGIGQNTTVYEPSAGNGALLIDSRATYTQANELNPDRAAALRRMFIGAKVTEQDATEFTPEGKVDVVIGNPPFGPLKDDAGNATEFDLGGNYITREIDHAISIKALESMKDDGSAVLIVGGINKQITDPKARADAYNGKAKREFYYKLYSQYNVVDHFTVDGSLYERQGAGWPVDLIVIKGRGKSALSLPAIRAPRQYDSWQDLAEVLKNGRPQEITGTVRAANGDAIAEGSGPAAVDAANTGSSAVGGDRGRDRSNQNEQPDSVRDGLVDRQPASDGMGRESEVQSSPVSDQRQRRADRSDSVRLAGEETGENARQVSYTPGSGANPMGTLVPINMQSAIDDALDALRNRVGDIDKFVGEKLGYGQDALYNAFGAEQIDAIALAIDNIENGAGFIIGDQTGIGKGRVVAAVIRYAIRENRPPIFVTEKPQLYKDMFRDMEDIDIGGMLGRDINAVMTNAAIRVPLDEDGNRFLKSLPGPKQEELLNKIAAEGLQANKVDVVMTTYSQMQTIKGETTNRMTVLRALAGQGGVLILDESHNAGGTSAGMMKKKPGEAPNRAEFVRELVNISHGVFYSSATYAKRPDVMDLYAATDMRKAVKDPKDLGEAIAKGGVPMQQVVAAMLARAGQYVRRERSFDGIAYNTPTIDVDMNQYAATAGILAAIQDFSELYVGPATEVLSETLKAEAKSVSFDGSVGTAGATSTNFTSVMHNVIDQMLLAFSAEAAADRVIASIKAGEKPVVTVANTLEAMLKEYADDAGISNGEVIDITFANVFRRYLERTRWITVKKPFSAKGEKGEKMRLTDNMLGFSGVAAFRDAMEQIDNAGLESLPGSPLDYIISRVTDAGFTIGEITGRTVGLNYRNGKTYLKSRPQSEKSTAGKIKAIAGFNSGKVDAMLLNRSGSTGLSLHASKTFKDQRKRRMILAQAEGNIDTHMQMLGRVHRTGQVVLPEYDQLVINVPAAKRPAAVLAKKMASLNANTTASRDSALTSTETIDFMNVYGDEVAANIMAEEPDIHRRLGEPLSGKEEDEGFNKEDAARRVTGRIPLLPVEQQEDLYRRIEEEYIAFVEQKNAAGENALEAKTFELDAVTEDSIEVVPAAKDAGDSPFGEAVRVELVDVKRLGKPYPSSEVAAKAASAAGVAEAATPTETIRAILAENRPKHVAETREWMEKGKEWNRADIESLKDDKAKTRAAEKFADNLTTFRDIRGLTGIGEAVRLVTENGNYYGIVTDLKRTGNSKNPLAPGSWKATFAVVDGARSFTFPFSQLMVGRGDTGGKVRLETVDTMGQWPVIEAFDKMQTTSREKRAIVTGNMLAGFDYVKGRGAIINYTTDTGEVRQGIVMPKDFDLAKHEAKQAIRLDSPEVILAWLNEVREPIVGTGNTGSVSIFSNPYRNEFTVVAAKSKKVGGEFFLNARLIEALDTDFVSRSNGMVASTPTSNAEGVIEALLSMGVKFEIPGTAAQPTKDRAKELIARIDGAKPKFSVGGPSLFDEPAQPEKTMTDKQRAELEARQKQGMARKGGQTGLMDQEGGLFAGERDQGSLFSARNPRGFGQRAGFAADTKTRLQAELNKLGIGDRVLLSVAKQLHNDPYVRGSYYANVIKIATGANPNAFETLNHEAIHALKDLGLFKPAEWAALEKAALGDKALMAGVRSRYARFGLTESELVEEAVADMFAAWRAGTVAYRGFIRDAFERMLELFRTMRRTIMGANAQDEARAIVRDQAMGVMESVASGEVGRRNSPAGLMQSASERAMVAYHGTPHDFDIFSTDAIGTGEGAQAYGWGLYFTDTKGVAEYYRQSLSGNDNIRITATYNGKTSTDWLADAFTDNGVVDEAADVAQAMIMLEEEIERNSYRDFINTPGDKFRVSPARVTEAAEAIADRPRTDQAIATKMIEIADSLQLEGTRTKRGKLLKVEIPEDGDYLLWDEPMSAQPKVKEAVGAWIDSQREAGINGDEIIGKTIEALEKLIVENAAGADIVMVWQRRMSPRSVSMALKDNGIAGTKYLDRNSRGVDRSTKTFNYVIFDAGNVEVREKYSVAGKLLGDKVVDGILDRLDVWRTNLQDRMLPLLRAQQRVEAQSGTELDEAATPYLAEELMSGKVGARLERLTDEMVTPLFNQMKAEGVEADELETYLYARHAVERNARISQINPQFDEGTGSGMTDAEAGGILMMAEAEGKLPALERLADKVDAILKFAVQTRVEAGLLSEEEAEAWAETYEHYVPLRGFAEVEPEAGEADRPRFGSGINVRGPESKRAFGRTSKAADILAYSIMQAEEAIVRAGRNEVAQAFYAMVKANPDDNFWTTKTVRRTPVWNEKSGTVSYRTTDRIDPQDEPYTVSLKIDGQERRVTMNRDNPQAVRLATAMRNLAGTDLGAVMRFLSGVNRYLSFVNTGLNPEFVITNAFRDMQTAGINLAQFDKKGLIAGTLKDYRKALTASVRGSFKNEKAGAEWTKWYREFLDNGGRVYFNRVDDLNEIRDRIAKQMTAKSGTLGVAKSTFNNIKEFIENANMGVENAIRLSAYKNARERGMSPAQAASLAKNLTVNFNRRGNWGTAMNSLYLFYNASIQGSARLMQAAFAKGKGGNRVRIILGAAVGIGFALDMLNMMLSDDDDDGESYYNKVSDFDKSRNLIIMLPGEKGKHFKIPLPYGYNAFFALGRSASQISRGEDWKHAAGGFLQTVVDAFNPIGGTDNLMNLIAPTIVDPIVDLFRNRDFADRPIMPEQSPYAPETPDSQKYWDSISPHWKVVTDTLNSMTGGDEVVGGAIDVSPETLQHLSGVVTGAAGTFFIDRIGGLAEKAVTGEEINANDLPLVRKVVGTKPSWYDKAAYYDRVSQIENVAADIKEYRTRLEDDKADAYEDSNLDLLDMVKPMKEAKKQLRKLKKERGEIEKARDIGDLSADDARAEIGVLRDEELMIMQEFNAEYIATVAKPKRP